MKPAKVRLPNPSWPDFPSTSSAQAKAEGGTEILTIGHHVARWLEDHVVEPSGPNIGKPLRLMPWQRQLLLELFEVVPADTPQGWTLRHRWAFIGVPKKNGKSSLIASLALWFLVADPLDVAPVVVCAAASEGQADLVFGSARQSATLSPSLSSAIAPYDRGLEVLGKPGAKMRRVAAVAGANDGLNCSVVVLDELHEWLPPKGPKVWNVLTNATGARDAPMVLQITTAGADDESVGRAQYDHATKVLRGEIEDPTYYACIFEAPEDADWQDEEVWKAANPSLGRTVRIEYLRDQARRKPENVFRRYHLNQWVPAISSWDVAEQWNGLAGDPREDPGAPCFVGLDLSHRTDTTAVVWVQRLEGRIHVHWRIWSNPWPVGDPRHAQWRVDLGEVEALCRDLYRRFPVPALQDDEGRWREGPAFLYDPAYFSRSAEALELEGLHMIEVPQTDSRMVPATLALIEEVETGNVVHDGSQITARQMAGVVLKERERGPRIARPRGARAPIDFVVALAMALLGERQRPSNVDSLSVEERLQVFL